MSIRERLDSLSRGELAGLVVVVVATLLGAGLWYMRSLPRPVAIAAPVDAATPVVSPISGPTGSAGASAAAIIVDVAGWVREPGVYEFTSGDRVIDAIDRAGGPRKGADLTTLNLAAPLTDGTQIVIAEARLHDERRSGFVRRRVDGRRDHAHQHQLRGRDRAGGASRCRTGDRRGHHRLPHAERAVRHHR